MITIKQQPKSLLETIKWPLIGIGASLISITLLVCAATLLRKHSTSGLSVKIENNSANNPEIRVNQPTTLINSINPSAPPFNPTFKEESKTQPTEKEGTIEEKIATIKSIKPEHRTTQNNKMLHQLALELQESSRDPNMA